MEIKIKKIDISYYMFQSNITLGFYLLITNPLFYLYITKFKFIYFMIDIILIFILIIILNIIFFIIVYAVYKIKNYNLKIKFDKNYLEIEYKKGNKKIYYEDIEIIIIEKNMLGSFNILINHPTNRSFANIFNNFRKEEEQNIVLNNIVNYEEILLELLESTKFNGSIGNKIKLRKNISLVSLFTIVYVIILLTFFYNIKYSFVLLPLGIIKILKKSYKYNKNIRGIKIYDKRKIIYLKENNYIIKDNRLILKVKKADSLFEKEVFIIENNN